MRQCTLCGLEFEETDLTRYFLRDSELIQFIKETQPEFSEEEGACSRCLEQRFQEFTSKRLQLKNFGDEKTVVTTADDLVQDGEEIESGGCLIVIHGADFGKKYDLMDAETIVGRGDNAQIRVNEENVSRQHAKLFARGAEVILEDLKSTNGTFVNTRKITSTPLRHGDLVLIGNTILKFISGSNLEHQYHEEIYKLATVDGLTGLFNKTFFLEKLEEEFSRSQRYQRSLSIILYDFDHFKIVNDTHGHLGGDKVLKEASTLILRNMRKEDVCGRIGGEEFGIILPEIPKSNAVFLADKIRKMIRQHAFMYDNKKMKVSISAGVASIAEDIKTTKDLLRAADFCLYRAKKDGRDCVRY